MSINRFLSDFYPTSIRNTVREYFLDNPKSNYLTLSTTENKTMPTIYTVNGVASLNSSENIATFLMEKIFVSTDNLKLRKIHSIFKEVSGDVTATWVLKDYIPQYITFSAPGNNIQMNSSPITKPRWIGVIPNEEIVYDLNYEDFTSSSSTNRRTYLLPQVIKHLVNNYFAENPKYSELSLHVRNYPDFITYFQNLGYTEIPTRVKFVKKTEGLASSVNYVNKNVVLKVPAFSTF